jgi:hypothetical protein
VGTGGADGTTRPTTDQPIATHVGGLQGRARAERPLEPQGERSPTLVEIFDVVAGCGYLLDDQNKVAHRVTFKTPAGVDAAGGGTKHQSQP